MTQENKKMPKIALGAWAWGNDGTFGNEFTAEALRPIFDKAMENGLDLWVLLMPTEWELRRRFLRAF